MKDKGKMCQICSLVNHLSGVERGRPRCMRAATECLYTAGRKVAASSPFCTVWKADGLTDVNGMAGTHLVQVLLCRGSFQVPFLHSKGMLLPGVHSNTNLNCLSDCLQMPLA